MKQQQHDQTRRHAAWIVLALGGLAIFAVTPSALILAAVLGGVARLCVRWAGLPAMAALAFSLPGLGWIAADPTASGTLRSARHDEIHAVWPGPFWSSVDAHWPAWLLASAPLALILAGVSAVALPPLLRRRAHGGSQSQNASLGGGRFARWRLARRLAKGRRLPNDAVLLGVGDHGRVARLNDAELEAHTLLVGASGAGKTTTMLAVLRDLIRRGQPVAYVDLKGDPAAWRPLHAAAKAAGRPFALFTLRGPHHWNPLAEGDPTVLKDKLVGLEEWTEPHYKRAAERYLQNVFTVLEAAGAETRPTLSDVVALMEPARLNARLRDVPEPLADRVAGYLDGLPPDQLSAIRGLGTRLAVITESTAGTYLEPNGRGTISLRRLLARRGVVVFSLDSSSYGELAAQLGGLVIQDLKAVCGQRLQTGEELRAYVAIDEFSALDRDHLRSVLVRGRASGISLLIATQSLADLERAGDGFRDTVIDNTQVKLIHRQDVPDSAETLAGIAGTETVWDHTHQTSDDLAIGRETGLGSRRRVEQYRIHPNRIKALRTGQAVLISKHGKGRAHVIDVVPAPEPSEPEERS